MSTSISSPILRSCFIVEKIVDCLRQGGGNTLDLRNIAHTRIGDRFCRSKMAQQSPFAHGADIGHIIERIARHALLAPRPVRANREPMRFIAQDAG